jgi:hypothetical protein
LSFSDKKTPGKINRRPDSCESLDARAALPQNCSGIKLNAGTYDVNSTDVLEVAHRCAIVESSNRPIVRDRGNALSSERKFLNFGFTVREIGANVQRLSQHTFRDLQHRGFHQESFHRSTPQLQCLA